MGFHKDQYLDLFYLPCTPLHLAISSAIIIWISTFMLMIRNFIYHLSHVVQCLDRPPYHSLSLHQWQQNMDNQQLVKIKLWQHRTYYYYHQWNNQPSWRHCPQHWWFIHCTSMEPPRNLGILFDSTCRLNDHVNKICQNVNYQLYSIGKIQKYLDKPTTEKW